MNETTDVQNWVQLTDALGKIIGGNMIGFFIMLLLVFALAYVVRAQWRMLMEQIAATDKQQEDRYLEVKLDLKECNKQHQECRDHNRLLAEAVLCTSEGHKHEARARAEFVLGTKPAAMRTTPVTPSSHLPSAGNTTTTTTTTN